VFRLQEIATAFGLAMTSDFLALQRIKLVRVRNDEQRGNQKINKSSIGFAIEGLIDLE
jgi:hypothetical protein